jgi:hypothetical protein
MAGAFRIVSEEISLWGTAMFRCILMVLVLLSIPDAVRAQQGPGGGGGGAGGGQLPGGILIRADGLIDRALAAPLPSSASRVRRQLAEKNLSSELLTASPRRTLSLRKLDEALAKHAADSTSLPVEIRYLAGLTRIDEVQIDGTGDLLISGPGEAFAPGAGGRLTGLESGRPVLCLEDLLVALRTPEILERCGCSIDPDPQRLAQSQMWLQQNSSPATLQVAQARMENMVRLMGRWNVTTFGVPEDSRMSLSMVEADYIMKRLAIGVDRAPVGGLRSTLQLAKPGDNMMRRWWFAAAPGYLTCTADKQTWVLTGPRFQLLAQEELLASDGTLIDSDHAKGSSEEFARLFNDRREELAKKVPAFADLQNLFDVLVVAAIFQEVVQSDSDSPRWVPQVLTSPDVFPPVRYPVPRETQPLLTTRQAPAGPLIGAFSGGVVFASRELLRGTMAVPGSASQPPVVIPEGDWWTQAERVR